MSKSNVPFQLRAVSAYQRMHCVETLPYRALVDGRMEWETQAKYRVHHPQNE